MSKRNIKNFVRYILNSETDTIEDVKSGDIVPYTGGVYRLVADKGVVEKISHDEVLRLAYKKEPNKKGKFTVEESIKKCRTFAALEEIAEKAFQIDTSDSEWKNKKLSEQKKILLSIAKKK